MCEEESLQDKYTDSQAEVTDQLYNIVCSQCTIMSMSHAPETGD